MAAHQHPRLPIAIPGIMGSSLWYAGIGGKQWIWPANANHLYGTLLQSPEALAWNGRMAKAEMIESLNLDILRLGSVTIHPWSRLLKSLESHLENSSGHPTLRIGYDWRASLLDTSATLSAALTEAAGSDVSQPPTGSDHPKFIIIAHSMGGLLLRATLGTKRLDPGWIDRIILIGSPLCGAPEALRSLYEGVNLPLLQDLYLIARPLHYREFRRIVSNAFATFPSLAQLLVPESIEYLRYSAFIRSNPLRETTLPAPLIQAATAAHTTFKTGDEILKQAGTTIFKILTQSGCSTEVEYEVESVLRPQAKYRFLKINHDREGDGTVPADSASYSMTQSPNEKNREVHSVVHSKMCNNKKIADILAGML
jgi:pimeloyl-ACP methyl ester carboxylesterase